MTTEQLLSEIREFLARTGMGATYFGKLATGNTMLVSRLEAGRSVTLDTAARIRAFMAEHGREREKA